MILNFNKELTCVPSRPASGESLTPKVMEIVGGSNSKVGKAAETWKTRVKENISEAQHKL